jgi:HTH-type transcriptional regulator/antitoxin HigA
MTATVTEYRSALRVIPVVTNDVEHDAVLAEIDELMDREPERASPDGVRLRLLARIASEFEHEHYPIEPLTPPETIAFAMERHGITRAQIGEIIGGASRVADLLNARRRLKDVDQLRALAALLRVPFDLLTIPYQTVEPKQRTASDAADSLSARIAFKQKAKAAAVATASSRLRRSGSTGQFQPTARSGAAKKVKA